MRSNLLALALLAMGCGKLNDLSLASGSLVTVKGHVDLLNAKIKANGHPMLGGIIWAALPSSHPVCFEVKNDPMLQKVCPDPFGFFPGVVDVAVPIDPAGDGTFSIDLQHLPSASAVVGTDVDHVAYATLAVFADDGDGKISFGPRMGSGGDKGQQSASAGGDAILAASFVSLLEPQQRLSFREGNFAGLNLFYPAPGCGTPPDGFSVLDTDAYTTADPNCTASGLGTIIDVKMLSTSDADGFTCRAGRFPSRTAQPDALEPPKGPSSPYCVPGTDILLLTGQEHCPQMEVFALHGCRDDPQCEKPEWDERANPPGWWPCGH